MQDCWIILQTLCPYWIGVLTLYAAVLAASLWLSYQLRFDFQVTSRIYEEFWRSLPWMVAPQLVFLLRQGQVRGLLSYFSLPELRQTLRALGLALLCQGVLWLASQGRLLSGRSVILLDFILSVMALCVVRLAFRSLRQRGAAAKLHSATVSRRVVIIGAGDLATRLALDLQTNPDASAEVLAFFDDDPHLWHTRPHDIPVVGMPECLLNGEWSHKVDEIIVALPAEAAARIEEIARMLKPLPMKVTFASTWPVLQSDRPSGLNP